MITKLIEELIYNHGTAAFLMYHIGDIPSPMHAPTKYPVEDGRYTNRQMITSNLMTLCLGLIWVDGSEAGDSA